MDTSSTQAARRKLSGTVVVGHPKVMSTMVHGETVLMNTAAGKFFGLDDIGTDIWNRIQVSVSVDALCAALASEYEGSVEDIRRDVQAFLEWLADNGLIEVGE